MAGIKGKNAGIWLGGILNRAWSWKILLHKLIKPLALIITLLWVSTGTFGAIDAFEFSDEQQREMFQSLSKELRCPKCQNQNLAGSNSAIALDLRQELHRLIVSGQTTAQIKEFMVERYGQFVLYQPRVNKTTYLLWYGPFVFLLLGFMAIYLIIRGNKRSSAKLVKGNAKTAVADNTLEHAQRIEKLLGKKDD